MVSCRKDCMSRDKEDALVGIVTKIREQLCKVGLTWFLERSSLNAVTLWNKVGQSDLGRWIPEPDIVEGLAKFSTCVCGHGCIA